jgi:uncharacterized protein (TIGR04141 family)
MGEKTNKLNVYLVKAEYTRFSDIVKPDTRGIEIEGVGTFFAQDSHSRLPDWVKDFFLETLARNFTLRTSSAKGVLLARASKRVFAIAFGHGRHLLNEGVLEERFGLKVVLNSVSPQSLRSIDKTTLGSVPKQSREQLSLESEAANFGIDIEQDLLNAVTGRSKDTRLGKTISGRDALALSVKVDVSEIKAVLPLFLDRFQSEDYKENFDWIDQITDVRDKKKVAELNSWLVSRLENRELDNIWMAPPNVIDWVDVRGFRYSQRRDAPTFTDLSAEDFLNSLDGGAVDLDVLKSKVVLAISAKTDEPFEHWRAYRCLYAEARMDDSVYVLNNGKWYRIAADFAEQVLAYFNNIPESEIELPDYDHRGEGEYNESLPALVAGTHCLDRKLIRHGGGHSAIEFCDLITEDKRLVHVKRYGGSAQFSHLFNQGAVSGELFAKDEEFRKKLNEHLPRPLQLSDTALRPELKDYEIVFAIISKSDAPLEIPFFSKVALRNTRRRLEGYGYRVTKKKVINKNDGDA